MFDVGMECDLANTVPLQKPVNDLSTVTNKHI